MEIPIFKWQQIRAILGHKFFANLYIWLILVPIFANATQEFPSKIEIVGTEPALTFKTELPFTWTILYFAALLTYLSWLIYSIRCPAFIQSFENPAEAIVKGETAQSIRARTANHLDGIKKFCSEREYEMAMEAAKTWRAPSADNDSVELLAASLLIDRSEAIPTLSKQIEEALLSESSDKAGYYELPKRIYGRPVRVEKNQFLKHVCRDLIQLCDEGRYWERLFITLGICISACLVLVVLVQGLSQVLSAM